MSDLLWKQNSQESRVVLLYQFSDGVIEGEVTEVMGGGEQIW